MSGHSKWATIKHQKASADQKRGLVFSKLSSEIAIAVSEGKSGDPTQNPRLRSVLEKARSANMPSDNVGRAIKRGLGVVSGEGLEEVMYEGYGPSGVAVLVQAQTDNRHRTTAQIKNLYELYGGSLGGPGSCAFLFERSGGEFVPKVRLPVHEATTKQKLTTFFQALHALAEVKAVYSNAELQS